MPDALQLRMRELAQLLIDVARQINPTNHACDKLVRIRQLQQPSRLGDAVARLHDHYLIDAMFTRVKVRRQIIAIEYPEIARHPRIIKPSDLPEVFMRVDDHYAVTFRGFSARLPS
jgi:hypothetical protein